MVHSRAETVGDYLEELPDDRRVTIERLLRLVRASLPGTRRSMRYGMLYFERPDGVGLAIASQVQYVAIYGLGPLFPRFQRRLRGVDHGKNCLRFRRPGAADWTLIEEMLRALDTVHRARLRPRAARNS